MTNTTLTDAQIDARATAYARSHGVSYSEALSHVTEFSESASPAAASSSIATTQVATLTDAELHAAASRYAAQHGLDYVAALRIVLESQRRAQGADSGAANGPGHASDSDRRIDAAATAYARANGVSYSEALTKVTTFAASFSEGAPSFGNGGLQGSADADAVRAMQSQPIEIFRAGTHVDNAGNSRSFSVADVKAMATSYSPARQEAPLTLGHPDTNHPAYGWVKSLTATEDGRLLMLAGNVDPELAAGVKAGRYKKRSASFYPPLAPNNPAPGQWYLRHVGWLGAQQPAVKGLADVRFGEMDSAGAVCFGWE